jgi:hypothetical protein
VVIALRLVLHKAVVSRDHMEFALYGRPPELSEVTQNTARSQTSSWLPLCASVRTPGQPAERPYFRAIYELSQLGRSKAAYTSRNLDVGA